MTAEPADAYRAVVDEVSETLQANRLEAFVATGIVEPDSSSTTSKLGGLPWWPESEPTPTWPASSELPGKPLCFVGQVNLAELPFDDLGRIGDGPQSMAPAGLGTLPRTGLLQVWVDGDLPFGLEFGDDWSHQSGWRFVHWPAEALDRTSRSEPPAVDQSEEFPISLEPGMCVRLEFTVQPTYDADLLDALYGLGEDIDDSEARWSVREEVERAYQMLPRMAPTAQVGGHPYLNQDDPRREGWGRFMLLELGTHRGGGAGGMDASMWADDGAAHFFVGGPDPGKWGRVFYSWECG